MKPSKYAVFLSSFLLLAATTATPSFQNTLGIRPMIAAAAEDEAEIKDSGTLNDSISWNLYDTGTLIITGSGDMSELTGSFTSNAKKATKVVIENTDKDNTITAIAVSLFSNWGNLTEVKLPDTITSIGKNAFFNCTKLSVCNFPSTLGSIGEGAFCNTGLTELVLPGCELGSSAFSGCSKLTTVTVGENAKIIPRECFRNCTSLQSVMLPDTIETIGATNNYYSGAFCGCNNLKTVSIGSNIQTIEPYAFRTEGKELEITFRDGVTAIPAKAFYGRTELTKVNLPSSLTTINDDAFRECSHLKSISLPESVTEIGERAFLKSGLAELELPGCTLGNAAFMECTSLKNVTIAEGATIIPQQCFCNCTSLESAYLPDTVETIDATTNYYSGAFCGCKNLKTVSIGKNIKTIASLAFRTEGTELEVTFRKNVTEIPANAFNGRAELTKVNLPSTLTTINANAFKDCTHLSSCNFPDSLTEIGETAFENTALPELTLPGCSLSDAAFANCTSLRTVTIGEGTKTIPTKCFYNCNVLESVMLPDSVVTIDATTNHYSGAFCACKNLKTVSIGKTVKTIEPLAFRTEGTELEITFRDGVTAIPANSFKERTELTSVILPDTLSSIGNSAFNGCTNLSSCNFPSGLDKIGESSFNNTSLKSLKLPGCELSNASFSHCTSLKTVVIGEGTKAIPSECFRDCTALENVVLPDSVESLNGTSNHYSGAFCNCTKLKKVSIGTDIEAINSNTFNTFGKELELTFREGVTEIPSNSLTGDSITAIILPESLTQLGKNDISGCSKLQLVAIQSTDCEIDSSLSTIPAATVIRSYIGSTAQSYAEANGRNFETFNEDDPIISYGNSISGVSLTLDGKIGLNFIAKLNSKADKVVLTGCGKRVEYSGDKLAEAKQADGTYRFTFSVDATQAGKKITFAILGKDGKNLDIYNSSYEKVEGKYVDYSVNDYIANAPEYSSNAKLKAMVNSLDQYCKAAENYFLGSKNEIDVPDSAFVKTNDFKKKFRISLVLNSGTALRIYSDASAAVLVEGKTETPLTAVKEKNSAQYFDITDIPAFRLLDNVTIKLDGETFTVCPMDYCALTLSKSDTNSKLKDVCNALYYYGVNAKEYKNSIEK